MQYEFYDYIQIYQTFWAWGTLNVVYFDRPWCTTTCCVEKIYRMVLVAKELPKSGHFHAQSVM